MTDLIIGNRYYHVMMAQEFELLALHEDCAWLVTTDDKIRRVYMSTPIENVIKKKAPLPVPKNGVTTT